MKLALLAIAALASTALAAPATTSSGSCALHCTSPFSFAYQTGKTYVYDYSIETSSALVGVSDDDAKMRITAHAHIDISAPCEYILRVTDVNLEGSAHAGEFAEAVTKYPLKFSFQDGMIENICSDVSEPTWVLNIKRGFLSTFQNTMSYHQDVQEKDVSGVCKTHYNAVDEGNMVIVEKITDLSSCSQRPDFSSLITSTYETDSPVQTLPVLKTTNECHQQIRDGILMSAECEEIYKTRPFQDERSAALTTVKTAMVLLSQDALGSVPDFEFYRQSLVFDDGLHETSTAQLEKVSQLLSDLVASSQDGIHAETPALFSKLVELLKSLDYPQLSEIYASASELNAHKFLVDAMPIVGTSAATALVRDMILSGEMNKLEADIWFTSLAFYKNPSTDMLNTITPLLETSPSQKALLGTSALINNYCKIHMTCETETVVQQIVQLFENQLGAGCRAVNDEEKIKVLVALKALGNAGHWVNAKSVLETCYTEENDMEIRVAALDAWRHAPCEYDHSNILALFQDESLDPELRIAAYLSLMSCPTPSLINIVKERLISEGVNQVGSFIWTHMTNLQESAAPEKQWMHEMIGEELLQKKFNTEALRFSRNYESSFFMNELNVGASVESNVIFNSKSYLPRSAMLNLTLDLFGESINFFEIGGRIEGFEAYIERFFGSNGYFPEEHIEQVLRNMRSKSNAESTTLEGFLDKISDEPEGSYYLRVFGNELHYHHFHGMENILMSSGASSPMDLLMDLFRKGNVEYTKSFQITNTHLHIPTISGLPLVLDEKITGTLGLEMNGNFNAQSLTNINVEGHLHPSAALEVDGLMIVDAHVTKTGVKMSATLHTSTFLDGKLQVVDGKVVDIAINSPKDKVEVLDVKGEFFYLIDDQEMKKEVAETNEYQGCTSGVLGMAVCVKSKNTPITDVFSVRPFAAELYLEKSDTQTGYVFQFKRETDKLELLIDTPGSQNDHKVALTLVREDNAFTIDVHTPVKSAKGTLEYTWTNLDKKMKVAVTTMDSGEVYSFETGLLKTTEDVTIYEPSLIVTLPVGEVLNIHGILKSKLDYYDTMISTKMDVLYKWGSQQTIHFEVDAMKKLTDSMSTYSLHGAVDPTQFSDFKSSIDVTFTEKEHQHYKAQVNGVVKGETYILEGTLNDNSVRGKFNVIADGSLTIPALEAKANLGIYADSEKVSADFTTTVNGQNYDMKVEGTKTSVLIEANIIRHILLNAYVTSSGELQKLHIIGEWNKDVDPTAMFMIDCQMSQVEVKAQFKFSEREVLVSGKLLANGVELEGKWDDKRVFALVQYTLGETNSLSVSVETPFPGLEKQDATFSVTLKDYEINTSFAATWQNSQQLALNVVGKLEPGMLSNALHTEVLFSSSFPKFERISFDMDHKMVEGSIATNMVGLWDSWEVKTIFQAIPSSDGLQASLSLESPFTKNMLISLNHVLSNKDLTSTLEAKYGESVATALLKGHIDLGDVQDVTLALKINLPSATVPEIIANLNYKFNWSQLQLAFEGVMGENKVMLNANGELMTGDSTKITGDVRFITPFTYPITATLNHTHDGHAFESKFEMTRFWSDYGSLKAHAEGHMSSSEDIVLLADFSTPSTKASVSLNHKVTDTNMISSLDVQLNGERITVSVNGLLDMSQSLANLEAEITSTLSGLDEMKITIESMKNAAERVSKIILTKKEQSVTIDHIILVNDIFNWENTFSINGEYKLKNVQTHTGTLYTHDMEYMWNSETVHLTFNLDNKSSDGSRNIDALVSLVTPWTEVIKAEFHHMDDGVVYKPVIRIEYVPGKSVELATIIKFGDVFSCESILTTPFTEPLEYKITLDFSSRKAATLMLTWGPRQITFDIGGKLEPGKMEGSLEIHSTYLSKPITAEVSYDIISPQKKVHLLVTYGQKLEITGLLSGDLKKGDWSLVAEFPLEVVKHMELTGTWIYELTKAEIEVHSAVTSFEEIAFYVSYDIESEKKVDVKLKYGPKMIHLIGKLEGETVSIEVSTPFIGWEQMKLSLFATETAIDAFVSKNDQTITVKGTMHVKLEKGNINLSITTPFTNYEVISGDLIYSLRGPVKHIELKSTFTAGEITLNGKIDLSNDLSPTMMLDIVTPFEVVARVGGEAHWDLRNTLKTAEVKAYRNDREYQWHLEVSAESTLKAVVRAKIVTPFSGWTMISLEGQVDVTKMPYMLRLVLDKEGVVTTIEGNFNLDGNAFTSELLTPIPGWEACTLVGDFTWAENHFIGNFEVAKSEDKYHLTADILFNTQTPQVHVTLTTPIAAAANVDLIFDSNLIESQKKVLITLKINDTTYSLDFDGQMIYKTGYVKLLVQAPIPGFSLINVDAKYDFINNVKTAEVDFKIEDDSKHFYLKTEVQKNKFHIEVHTPFEGFELIKMIGDYSAEHDKHTVLASFEKDHQTYDYNADVTLTDYSMDIALSTPIKEMKNIAVSIKFELFKNGIETLLHFKRNKETYEIKTHGIFTPLKSDLLVEVKTAINGWRKLKLDCKYDVLSEKKIASVFIQKGSFKKQVTIEGEYTVKAGSLKIEVPIEGFEVLGAAYTLNLDLETNNLDSTVNIFKNSEEWNFVAQGQYSSSMLVIRFQTPFEDFKMIAVDANIDFEQKMGRAVIELGSYKFSVQASYTMDDMFLKVTTPFDLFKTASVGFTYRWTDNEKRAMLSVIYNETNYVVNGILNQSPRTSEITLQATTPFPGLNNIHIVVKYDIDNKDELILAQMTSDQYSYSFKLGAGIEGTQAHLNWDFTSTFEGWNHVQFLANVNWAPEHKTLKISLGKDGNMNAITVSGDLIGVSEGSLIIHTPFKDMEEMVGYFKWIAGEKLEGKIDLVLPFYLVPKIHGDINLDLSGKIQGVINFNIAGELYTIKSNLVGASFEEGYSGDLEIYTPIHALSKVFLNGNIIITSWTSLQTHLKAELPSGTYELDLKAEYALSDSSFVFNIDTTLMNIIRKIKLEAKYPSLDNLEGNLVTVLGDQTHHINGKFNVASNHVIGNLVVESTLVEGRRQISFDISFPSDSYKHVSLNLTFVTEASHSLYMDLDATNGVKVTLQVDSPLFPKIAATLRATIASAGLSIETPQGTHMLQVSWRMTHEMPADYVMTVELASPLLPDTYIINVLLNGNTASMIFKVELMVGSVRHVIEGSTSMTDSSGDVSLNIETPIWNINKATLASSLKFAAQVEMHITATYGDKVNTFDLVYDKESRSFHVEIASPFIPTGMARGEGQIRGEMMKDMKIKMALQNNEQTISGLMNVKVLSQDNMKTSLIITTPFQGYKKMKFGAEYVKTDDMVIVFFIDKPVKFNTELRLRNTEQEIMTVLKVETPIEDFKKIEAELKIPLTVFGPKVSADLMLGGVYYGGHLNLRTKAPYELGAGYKVADKYSGNFHIRTDSSFFSFLA